MKKYQKIVLKIGTNVITQDNGLLDDKIINNIVKQVSELKKSGVEIIIVSSGAMGAGRSLITLSEKTNKVVKRQILAAVGQIKLMNTYSELFQKEKFLCAQVLATKEDFRDRTHYMNMKNCFDALLKDQIIPIVNENDVVSVSELMFTDNDELAGLIASMLNVDALILFTNVDGIFDRDPKEKNAKIIHTIRPKGKIDHSKSISPSKSSFGRGGMLTKYGIATKMSALGIHTYIANGKKENNLMRLMNNDKIGTEFIAHKKISNLKHWIAHNKGQEKAAIYINDGAEKILKSEDTATSLLPVGIIKIEGEFIKGEMVKICNEQGKQIGLGITQYSSDIARENIGQKNKKPLVHYDYLLLE